MLVFAAVADTGAQNGGTVSVDEALFPRIAEGDRDSFFILYESTSSAVFSFALSLLRDVSDAEDAMQETYLRIRGASHLYRPQGKPMAWIFTITRNICLMKFRKRKRFTVIPIEDINIDPGFDRISDAEDRMVLEAALRTLSRQECEIVMLHAVSGLKHREICELLELPLSTVISKYNRSLKKLRSQLEGKL